MELRDERGRGDVLDRMVLTVVVLLGRLLVLLGLLPHVGLQGQWLCVTGCPRIGIHVSRVRTLRVPRLTKGKKGQRNEIEQMITARAGLTLAVLVNVGRIVRSRLIVDTVLGGRLVVGVGLIRRGHIRVKPVEETKAMRGRERG